MIFGLNWPVTVVNCRREMSLRWSGIKAARNIRIMLPNAAAWFTNGGSWRARSTILVE